MLKKSAEALSKKPLRYGCTNSHCMTLTQRPGGIFHSTAEIYLRVPRSHTAPLSELHNIINSEMACEGQYRIEHRRHVSWIKEKAVSVYPVRIRGVKPEELRKQYMDEICSAHRTSGVA